MSDRKDDHLDLCATDHVAFKGRTTLFEQVHLIHQALPELSVDEIDLSTPVVGNTLAAPLVIAAMTGGASRAERVNRDLAQVAEELGLAFGFGSMRPLLENPNAPGYSVRDVAPTATLLGNLGVVQAAQCSTDQITDLVGKTGVDALCIHLNPAMELIQPNGDTDFRGGIDTLRRLQEGLPVPLIVKETGCGISRSVGKTLVDLGVQWVDVSGAGGTSWVGVETLRNRSSTRATGELFWDWGIPTAASVCQLSGLSLHTIATGGIHTGLHLAKALALGSTAGGVARPFLMAWNDGGQKQAKSAALQLLNELRLACLLTGSKTPRDLQQCPIIVHAELRDWIPEKSPIWARLSG